MSESAPGVETWKEHTTAFDSDVAEEAAEIRSDLLDDGSAPLLPTY